jgi:hypothetical protein
MGWMGSVVSACFIRLAIMLLFVHSRQVRGTVTWSHVRVFYWSYINTSTKSQACSPSSTSSARAHPRAHAHAYAQTHADHHLVTACSPSSHTPIYALTHCRTMRRRGACPSSNRCANPYETGSQYLISQCLELDGCTLLSVLVEDITLLVSPRQP